MTTPNQSQRVIIVTRTGQGITAFGKTMSLRAWAEITGLPRSTIHNRLRAGYPPEVAVSAPVPGLRR